MPIFDAASINATVAQELASVDTQGKKNVAAIMPARDINGKMHVTGVVATKVGDVVTLKGFFSVDEDKQFTTGFQFVAAWD